MTRNNNDNIFAPFSDQAAFEEAYIACETTGQRSPLLFASKQDFIRALCQLDHELSEKLSFSRTLFERKYTMTFHDSMMYYDEMTKDNLQMFEDMVKSTNRVTVQ